jgi:4-hydroxybenzoate polyprenyltransferase
MNIDPASAALYALIALCLVMVGAILTLGPVSVEQRGAVLGGIVVVLFTVYRLSRRRAKGDDEGE